MSWNYSTALIASRDIVRYLVSDTDSTDQLIQDEEIAYAVAQNPNVRLAAAEIADRIALQFARWVTTRVGDTQVNYSDRVIQYSALARQLRADAALRGAIPYVGGIALGDKQSHQDDTDMFKPAFTRTLFDFPNTDIRKG